MINNNDIFNEKLLGFMKEKNYSYYDMEKLTGISRSTLQRYVMNPGKVPLKKLVIIANAIGVSPGELLWGEEAINYDQLAIEILEQYREANNLSKKDLNEILKDQRFYGFLDFIRYNLTKE